MVAGDAVFPAAATKTPKSMNQYFFAKVSFLRQQNDGTIKKESEQYLVDAMSFTETEARVIKEVGESVRELYIDSVARSPITEVVTYGDTDLWFKCKVVYKDVDPDSGKEKKTTLYILVNANDVNEAYDRCKDHLKEMLVPFEIPKVEETAICEIYQYEKPVPAGYIKRGESQSFVNQAQKDEDALDAEWDRVNEKDNSEAIWAAMPIKEKDSLVYCINDGHYDPEIQGDSYKSAIEADAKRKGVDPKVYENLITYVECIVMNKHGHMDDDDDDDDERYVYKEGDEDGEY